MRISQAILPVAGLGTRFLPWTKVVPKELLPLGNQPIIAHLVDECLGAGIREICFVISQGKEAIPQYFYQNPALEEELLKRGKLHYLEDLRRYHEVSIHVVYQEQQHGDGHALLQARDWVTSDAVAILFGDDLFIQAQSGLQQLMRAQMRLPEHERGAMIALQEIPKDQTHKYGIVELEAPHPEDERLARIRSMVEKPSPDAAPSNLGIVGRYIVPRSTFDVLQRVSGHHDREIRLIDALISQLSHIPVYGYRCEGIRLDTGTPEGYRHAVQFFA